VTSHALRFFPIVFVWVSIAYGQDCACSTPTTAIDYPTAWAHDTSIVEQVRSAGWFEAGEVVEEVQKETINHTFKPDLEGGVKRPGPATMDEMSRYQIKATEEAVTFIIDHPIAADHLKAGFGVCEILSFHKDDQWVLVRDDEVLIPGRVNATQESLQGIGTERPTPQSMRECSIRPELVWGRISPRGNVSHNCSDAGVSHAEL
jgi:hypothetical protein